MAPPSDAATLPPALPGVIPPSQLNLDSSDKADNWKMWKQQWNNYLLLSNLGKLSLEYQTAMFENCLGPDGLRIYNSLSLGDEAKTLKNIMEKMTTQIVGEQNETYDRFIFNSRNQQSNESIDEYINELRTLAKSCNFCDCLHDSLLRDRIVMGIIDKDCRKRLLQYSDLKLAKCISTCRATEAASRRLQNLTSDNAEAVHKIQKSKQRPRTAYPKREDGHGAECRFCGRRHRFVKSECPAWGEICSNCNQKNHFAVKCPNASSSSTHSGRRKVHAVEEHSDSDIETIKIIHSIYGNYSNQIHAEFVIEGKTISAQIDCGASVNVIPAKLIGTTPITPTSTILQMWNKTKVVPLGEVRIAVKNPANEHEYRIKFIVVPNSLGLTPIIGSKASQHMGILTVHQDNIKAVLSIKDDKASLQKRHSEVFNEDLGSLPGTVHLEVDPSISPVVAPSRRVPVALREPLKTELKRLEDLQVIAPVEQPTDWVSNIVVATKKSGDLRVCIDPQGLNQALKRERYHLPTLDDILPDLSKARLFSTIDLKSGYWHVLLDEQSSLLTTFSTPYGRYRWLRLPFGCSVSSEIFQKKLHQALEGLSGVHCVADDIMLYGNGNTDEEALADHDGKLEKLLTRCQKVGIRLNKTKLKLRETSLPFLGHLVTKDGLKPDPEKIEAIKQMPRPTDVEGIQRLNGFVNYLAKFLPHLSDVMEPIRQLTRKDVPFNWAPSQENAFTEVKSLVINAPVLMYYDETKPLIIQCDASQKGLGAALLQNEQPIAFASRALTDTETRYAQIEKEMLAIVFAAEKFDQYTYGRTCIVHSDHKPLESILKKPLISAPKRLQGMMMRLQRYNLKVQYVQGKLLYLADTLSRAYLPTKQNPQGTFEDINMVEYLPISDVRLQEIREATRHDDELNLLADVILNGWPQTKTELPSQLTPYFFIRDELSVQGGLVFRAERVVVPTSLRQSLKQRVHSSHLGIESCLRRARECLYWPNMNSDIKDFIAKCEICRSHETSQQKETLLSHDVPNRPWAKVGTDLFSIGPENYLIVVDYVSNFFEVDRLENTESATVVRKLKAHFARYGIPDTVISDNGPQFKSITFARFAKDWDFEHLTSSPGHSQSNGKAESAVKTAKKLMKRAKEDHKDIYLSLLDHRNTPSQASQFSPSQILMSRRTKTLLPTSANLLKPSVTFQPQAVKLNQARQQKYYNAHASDLKPLEEGDVIRMKPFQPNVPWKKGTVTKRLDERSYEVEAGERTYRRNRVHLRASKERPDTDQAPVAPPSVPDEPGSDQMQSNAQDSPAAQEVTDPDRPPAQTPVQTAAVRRSSRITKPPARYSN